MLRTRRDPKRDRLAHNDGLAGCTADDIGKLASLGDELTIAAGEELTVEGGYGGEAFLVLGGTARVSRDGLHVADVGTGDFVGEMALLDHKPRSASVTALTDVQVLVFDPRAFGKLLHDSPKLARRLTSQMNERLARPGHVTGAGGSSD